MAYTKFEMDMAVISALDDEPNDTGGLTAAELKAKFDEGGVAVKRYLNETLLPEIDSIAATKEELAGVIVGQLPEGVIPTFRPVPFSEADWTTVGDVKQFTIAKAVHGLKNGEFTFSLWHLVGGIYRRNTWCVAQTEVRYEAETGAIVLECPDAFAGKVTLMG